jgi:ribosomal protein S9
MSQYKRNQVEEAISRTLGEESSEPSPGLRTQLKRLLDTDRTLTGDAREVGLKVTNFAFYSSESPGKGSEVLFSDYEAFALHSAWRLLEHSWPQSFVVNALRTIRPDFERQHHRILKQDPRVLFDEKAIQKKARPGDLGVDNTDPVFMTIVSGKATYKDGIGDKTTATICRGMEQVSKFIKQEKAQSWTLFELVTPAHRFAHELSIARPRSRGRS